MVTASPTQPKAVHYGPTRMLPMTPERTERVEQARKAKEQRTSAREAKINELCTKAKAEGQSDERGYWALVYDFEMAPATNGRTMLLERGILPVPPQDLFDDVHLHEALWTVIEGLAASGVYLLNTDHLTYRQLYERLYYKILDEAMQCMPPSAGSAEYIDVLHPYDIDAGGHGKELSERIAAGQHPAEPTQSMKRAPMQFCALCDRDKWLPHQVSD